MDNNFNVCSSYNIRKERIPSVKVLEQQDTQLFIESNNKIKKEKRTAEEIKDLKSIRNKEYKEQQQVFLNTTNSNEDTILSLLLLLLLLLLLYY